MHFLISLCYFSGIWWSKATQAIAHNSSWILHLHLSIKISARPSILFILLRVCLISLSNYLLPSLPLSPSLSMLSPSLTLLFPSFSPSLSPYLAFTTSLSLSLSLSFSPPPSLSFPVLSLFKCCGCLRIYFLSACLCISPASNAGYAVTRGRESMLGLVFKWTTITTLAVIKISLKARGLRRIY